MTKPLMRVITSAVKRPAASAGPPLATSPTVTPSPFAGGGPTLNPIRGFAATDGSGDAAAAVPAAAGGDAARPAPGEAAGGGEAFAADGGDLRATGLTVGRAVADDVAGLTTVLGGGKCAGAFIDDARGRAPAVAGTGDVLGAADGAGAFTEPLRCRRPTNIAAAAEAPAAAGWLPRGVPVGVRDREGGVRDPADASFRYSSPAVRPPSRKR